MYPKAKYKLGEPPALVKDAAEEKKLGKGWFDHPKDAAAGRVLTNVERGDDSFDPSSKVEETKQ